MVLGGCWMFGYFLVFLLLHHSSNTLIFCGKCLFQQHFSKQDSPTAPIHHGTPSNKYVPVESWRHVLWSGSFSCTNTVQSEQTASPTKNLSWQPVDAFTYLISKTKRWKMSNENFIVIHKVLFFGLEERAWEWQRNPGSWAGLRGWNTNRQGTATGEWSEGGWRPVELAWWTWCTWGAKSRKRQAITGKTNEQRQSRWPRHL